MNWRRWWCEFRGYHEARIFIRVEEEDSPFVPSKYTVLHRHCKCGATAKPKILGDLRPGGFITFDPYWPAGKTQETNV